MKLLDDGIYWYKQFVHLSIMSPMFTIMALHIQTNIKYLALYGKGKVNKLKSDSNISFAMLVGMNLPFYMRHTLPYLWLLQLLLADLEYKFLSQ